jgi:serine/threonine-protein kinase
MATVYLALDRKHDRYVALKVLHPELASGIGPDRFLREIHVAARLSHPHILQLHDSGITGGCPYYTMPYIEGRSLQERLLNEGQLPIDQAVSIASQVADALDHAHRQGIIHRDIKPANILIGDGGAIIADFGIARALDVSGEKALTETGLALGTPTYMSPEQGSADAHIDGRTDIYALGIVLYEMLTGQPPFTGRTAQAILARHAVDPVPSLRTVRPTAPLQLERAVTRALAKVPTDRFATAAAFSSALQLAIRPDAPVTTEGTPLSAVGFHSTQPSIAVLPFTNLSADPGTTYFSDGMTEDLINALVKVPRLRVVARSSVFAVKKEGLDARAIGERLEVTGILEGSVRSVGNHLRVTAQLIDAASGYHIWSEVYDRDMTDVFALQDEVARAIVDAFKLRLADSTDSRLVRPATQSLQAYTYYLKGRSAAVKRSPDGLRAAVEWFSQAVQADPSYALAYTGLAEAYHLLAIYGVALPKDTYPRARYAAERALALNDNLADAHLAAAYSPLCFEWDWTVAGRECRRAIDLGPSLTQAHHWLAWCLVITGQKAEAAEVVRRAMELEPFSPIIHARAGHILAYAGFLEESEAASLRALDMDPRSFVALETLATTYSRRAVGRYDEAVDVLNRALEVPGSTAPYFVPWVHALRGDYRTARQCLDALDLDPAGGHIPPTYTSMWVVGAFGALGLSDEAFRWLDLAVVNRVFAAPMLGLEEAYDTLRSDPRLGTYLRAVGLTDVAGTGGTA